MKVKEFVEMYKKNPRIDISKQLDVKQYVGIAFKREMAQLVLDNCTTIVDGEVHIDSLERYILFTLAVIGLHTNLEFYDDNDDYSAIDDYDALCEAGLLIKIIDTFKQDYDACQEILNMVTADKLQDNITFEKKVYQFFDALQDILDNVATKFADEINFDFLEDGKIDQGKILELYDLLKTK